MLGRRISSSIPGKFEFSEGFLFKVRGYALMRIVRGMQRLICEEQKVLGWKESFSQGIGANVPKARTRDKQISRLLDL